MGVDEKEILRAYMKMYGIGVSDLARYMGCDVKSVKERISRRNISGAVKAIEEITGERLDIFESRVREIVIKREKK